MSAVNWYNTHSMTVELDENGVPKDRETLKGRKFLHFKGKYYQLIDFVTHAETLETMVFYRQLYEPFGLWVRPAKMFFERVVRDGYDGPRFALVEKESE